MELYQIGSHVHWEFLQTTLTQTYQLLDPELPAEGRHLAEGKAMSEWRMGLQEICWAGVTQFGGTKIVPVCSYKIGIFWGYEKLGKV